MKLVSIDALPVSQDSRKALARTKGVDGCIVRLEDGEPRVVAFGSACELRTLQAARAAHPTAHAAWVRSEPGVRSSRTALALALIDADPTLTPYAAAKAANVNPSALYREQRRRDARGCCPGCGRLLPAPGGAAA